MLLVMVGRGLPLAVMLVVVMMVVSLLYICGVVACIGVDWWPDTTRVVGGQRVFASDADACGVSVVAIVGVVSWPIDVVGASGHGHTFSGVDDGRVVASDDAKGDVMVGGRVIQLVLVGEGL
jgi:hypothetical protein